MLSPPVPAGSREGAHTSAMPVVPCAQVITGQPALGALPFGIATMPDTGTIVPLMPTCL